MPSDKDSFVNQCFIITNPSHGRFHLYGDDPDEIDIGDIANALSKQCRFTGHMALDRWYSVAEHSCDVARIIKALGGSKQHQFAGLMHDTPEFALSDIAAPFKREIGNYYEKEALIWKRVSEKYGLPLALPPIVKQADWIALFIEALTFVAPVSIVEHWVGWSEHGTSAQNLMAKGFKMRGLSYKRARIHFLAQFERLSKYSVHIPPVPTRLTAAA